MQEIRKLETFLLRFTPLSPLTKALREKMNH